MLRNLKLKEIDMLYGGICFITDRTLSHFSIDDMVRSVLDAGIRFIQYREKALSRRDMYFQAEKFRRLTESYQATLIINDYPDIALAVDAEGVHLGQDDIPVKDARKIMGKRMVGISTHNLKQAKEAVGGGADYIGFGPIFLTLTKDAGLPQGLKALREVVAAVNIPVVAIGGINLLNLKDILKQGVSAVAVASGILKERDTHRAAKKFVNIIYESL